MDYNVLMLLSFNVLVSIYMIVTQVKLDKIGKELSVIKENTAKKTKKKSEEKEA